MEKVPDFYYDELKTFADSASNQQRAERASLRGQWREDKEKRLESFNLRIKDLEIWVRKITIKIFYFKAKFLIKMISYKIDIILQGLHPKQTRKRFQSMSSGPKLHSDLFF